MGVRYVRSTEESISGIHAVTSEQSIEAINAFTFKDKGVSQYTAFAASILLNAFAIYAITLCVTAKIGPKKWLWTLLMMFTFVLVSVNWTTGDWSFDTVSFGLKLPPLPSNLVCSAYGPWNLKLGLPIAAIVFVLYRKKLERTANAPAVGVGTC